VGKFDTTSHDHGVPLRERYERFCGRFVESRNPMMAFRLSFVVDDKATSQWVFEQADKLMADPEIKQRIQQMRDEAATATMVKVQELMQDWHDIAVADPNELISYLRLCCRYCHGVDFAYQYTSESEWALACARHVDLGGSLTSMPMATGGFGFNPERDPNPLCPMCFGVGLGETRVHDTRKLQGPARKLYSGVKQTKNGIEVLMQDKQKARESLARVLGAFKDGWIPVTPAVEPAQPISKTETAERAGKTYLRLVSG